MDQEEQDNDDNTSNNSTTGKHLKPNHELSQDEKSQKRGLKRLLKRQARRKKLETRLQQAIMREDSITEELSRKELEQFLKEEEKELLKTQSLLNISFQQNHPLTESSHQDETQARAGIEALYQRYYKLLEQRQRDEKKQIRNSHTNANTKDNNNNNKTYLELDALSLKEKQTAEARLLLLNMTKGTQQIHMFENQSALMGYVRQKFQERATLSISSLSKLDPRRQSQLQSQTQEQNEKQQRFWNQLLQVRSMCSIGCGPGCDAVGNIRFLQQFAKPTFETTIDRVVFLDWTMDKWKYFLEPLVNDLLIPKQWIRTAEIAFADVLKPLSDSSNQVAKKLLINGANNTQDDTLSCDLFVTSYLLTETRGKWHAFYKEIIEGAKSGTLFLHAEPTAWQLLTLIDLTPLMEFVWLDSSMHEPKLQAMEGRVGPAVLLGRKR